MSVLIGEPSDGGLVLDVGPAFLPEDAWRIHDLLESSDPGTRVEIDFRHVRDCHDFALSLLAKDMLAGRARIALRGTSQHQERVLGYFGVKGQHQPLTGLAADR